MGSDFHLLTTRLLLRPPAQSDAFQLQVIASDPRVALTTASIPYPYPANGSEEFIKRIDARSGPNRRSLAIVDRSTEGFIGMIGFAGDGVTADLTYLIAPCRWGQGFATEAGRAIVHYLFDERGYARVSATAMTNNPASERVLQKLGFEKQGEQLCEVPLRSGVFSISSWLVSRSGTP